MTSAERSRGKVFIERLGTHTESAHPRYVAAHPVLCGWAWISATVGLLVLCDALGGPGWLRSTLAAVAALPSILATVIVLSQTPRTHLAHEESILTHFFTRFLGLISAFVLWLGSVVIGAVIALQLATDDGTNVAAAWAEAFRILISVVPAIGVLLWGTLIIRYVGYMARLRGWAAVPDHHRIPDDFLTSSPQTRRIVIGLAHPALLLVAGLLSTLLALALTFRADALH